VRPPGTKRPHPARAPCTFAEALAPREAELAEHQRLFQLQVGDGDGVFDPVAEPRHTRHAPVGLRIAVRVREIHLGQRLHLAPDLALAPRAVPDVACAHHVVLVERAHEARRVAYPVEERFFVARRDGGSLVDELPGHDGGVLAIGHTRHAVGARHHALHVSAVQGLTLCARVERREHGAQGLATRVAGHLHARPVHVHADAAVVFPAVGQYHDDLEPALFRGGEHAVEVRERGLDPALLADAKRIERVMRLARCGLLAQRPDAHDFESIVGDGCEHTVVVLALVRAVHDGGVGTHEAERLVEQRELGAAHPYEAVLLRGRLGAGQLAGREDDCDAEERESDDVDRATHVLTKLAWRVALRHQKRISDGVLFARVHGPSCGAARAYRHSKHGMFRARARGSEPDRLLAGSELTVGGFAPRGRSTHRNAAKTGVFMHVSQMSVITWARGMDMHGSPVLGGAVATSKGGWE
jgi:hypothetical protein